MKNCGRMVPILQAAGGIGRLKVAGRHGHGTCMDIRVLRPLRHFPERFLDLRPHRTAAPERHRRPATRQRTCHVAPPVSRPARQPLHHHTRHRRHAATVRLCRVPPRAARETPTLPTGYAADSAIVRGYLPFRKSPEGILLRVPSPLRKRTLKSVRAWIRWGGSPPSCP